METQAEPPRGPTPADRAAWSVAFIWAGWALLLLAFQAFAVARIDLARPDNALTWTASGTGAGGDDTRPDGLADALAPHVAWDSQYYISIALAGYDDPESRAVGPASTPEHPVVATKAEQPSWPSANRAFLPGYPFAIRLVSWPLRMAGLAPVNAAALAGVIVSLIGALGAMLAAFDLARRRGGNDEGARAAFYLAIWPASCFLAQVYSEGIFLGLSLGALALLQRNRWTWAALLAVAAVWTRPTGVLLLIPFVWAWIAIIRPLWPLRRPGSWDLARAGLIGAIVLAWLVWRALDGAAFEFVETHYFGRGPFWFSASWRSWQDAFAAIADGEPQRRAYYLIEFAALAVALAASAVLWRIDRSLTIYGLAVLAMALTSGAALGIQRYVLCIPALVLAPARLGRSLVFDRLWTLANGLGLALLAISFSFGFWTG